MRIAQTEPAWVKTLQLDADAAVERIGPATRHPDRERDQSP